MLKIVKLCESAFWLYVSACDLTPNLSSKKNIRQIMISIVMSELLGKGIVTSLFDHDLEHGLGTEVMHFTQLCRTQLLINILKSVCSTMANFVTKLILMNESLEFVNNQTS